MSAAARASCPYCRSGKGEKGVRSRREQDCGQGGGNRQDQQVCGCDYVRCVRSNLLDVPGVLTACRVVRRKVESIQLPAECAKVDVIISEWMGYALLYESMLDSVLHAQYRFLKPIGGIMAPSQTRMVLALCDPEAVIKKRVGFWKNVYGFDIPCMLEGVYDEGIVEAIPAETWCSMDRFEQAKMIDLCQNPLTVRHPRW